jgi:ATP-binding cassette, subfamily B, bacterial
MTYALPRMLAPARRSLLGRLVFNGIAQAGATLGAARLVHHIFDTLMNTHPAPGDDLLLHVALVGAGLLGSAALLAWLRTVERSDAERMGQGYVTELRVTLFDFLSALSLRGLQRRSRGGVVLRFVGDLKMLRLWVSLGLSRILVAAVSSVVALGALAYVDPALAGAAALAIFLGLGTLLALGSRTRMAMREARRRQGYLSANVNEKVATIAVVQAFGQARRERGHLLRQSERLRDAMVEQARRSATLRSMGDFTAAMASAAVLLTGALEIADGSTTAATVVGAMTLVGMLVPGLRDLGLAFGYWNGAHVAQRKLLEFLASPGTVAQASGAPAIAAGGGSVEFRDVHVAGSLHGFSAVATPGRVTAIVGPNGGGKSTLLAVAARLLDPDAGQVLLDGQDIGAHSLASVHRSFGMVSPDLPLLRGTIERNLKYRWPKADEASLAQVRALCGIDELVAGLPEGLQTRVAEGGTNLSFGQRQRIALARALLGHPPVLLLDEADANLDGKSSKVLEHILANYDGTVLFVTHRLESAAAADHIWYVDKGILLQSGAPHELLHAPGPTARLFRTHISLAAG